MKRVRFEENHIHSLYSDGSHSLEEIFSYNQLHDKLSLTITDHVDKNTDWFSKYAGEIKKLRRKYSDFSVRIGCEVKIVDKGRELNATSNILNSAEVVLGSVHHFKNINRMVPDELIEKEYELTKILASNKKIAVLAHPFSMGKRFFGANPPLQYIKDVYQTCVVNHIKFEYNDKNSPANVLRFAQQEIIKGNINNFSFGSDVHDDCSDIGNAALGISPTINILVTGAGGGVGQSIIKSIKLSKINTKIVAVDNSPMATGLYRGQKAYIVPLKHETNYIKRIISICKREKIHLILVGTDVELEVLARNKKVIESETFARLIVSNLNSIRIADDKWKTVQFLKRHHFPYPKSCLESNTNRFFKENSFPMVVKPRVGARSIGFSIVYNEEELHKKVRSLHNPIIQEYLPQDDEEYTCGAFFYQGKNYGVITAKRWLRNGDTYKAIFKKNPELEKFIISVGKKLRILGPCNFQLRKTKVGPVIFEINCRFSGTTGAASFLGFNAVNAILQKLFFGRALKKLDFKESLMLRYWNEIFVGENEFMSLERKGVLKKPTSRINIF